MKQTYIMPNTQTATFVESNLMQMISPSKDNPADAPTNPDTPIVIPPGAPKHI